MGRMLLHVLLSFEVFRYVDNESPIKEDHTVNESIINRKQYVFGATMQLAQKTYYPRNFCGNFINMFVPSYILV